jgi:hypothetical protein
MLNLYAVKLWHSSQPAHFEIIEVRTYSPERAEHLARESFPAYKAQTTAVLVDGAWLDRQRTHAA